MPKHEAHPARGILAIRRIPIREVASQLDRNEQAVARILNGDRRATPKFRRQLARWLCLPEADLFAASLTVMGGPAGQQQSG